jgi:hypothetical protein
LIKLMKHINVVGYKQTVCRGNWIVPSWWWYKLEFGVQLFKIHEGVEGIIVGFIWISTRLVEVLDHF